MVAAERVLRAVGYQQRDVLAQALGLGVGLDDIFEIQATAVDDAETDPQFDLTRAESRRMAELLDKQGLTGLSQGEQGELEHLLSEFGRRLLF